MIAENLKSVTQRIARCCEKAGRRPEEVDLVCVTKEAGIPRIDEALALGVRIIGENRVQDALAKHRVIGPKAAWHLVGHLQTNKARDAVNIFSLIHSLDSVHLAREIDKEAKRIGKVQDALVQVNVSGEKTKFGVLPDVLTDIIKGVSPYQNISIKGLMTIAPAADDPEKSRPYFRKLKELLDKINERRAMDESGAKRSLPEGDERRILSMGMTDDFEVAIEEGSTMVRIGRAIFS